MEFFCSKLSDTQRQQIREAYFGIGNLQVQREWIDHIDQKTSTNITEGSRRGFTISYFLPKPTDMDAPGYNRIPVCKTMFLDTLGISGRQIRTSLKKINSEGVLETEGRGGRPTALKEADRAIRKGIEVHINRFPKVGVPLLPIIYKISVPVFRAKYCSYV